MKFRFFSFLSSRSLSALTRASCLFNLSVSAAGLIKSASGTSMVMEPARAATASSGSPVTVEMEDTLARASI